MMKTVLQAAWVPADTHSRLSSVKKKQRMSTAPHVDDHFQMPRLVLSCCILVLKEQCWCSVFMNVHVCASVQAIA